MTEERYTVESSLREKVSVFRTKLGLSIDSFIDLISVTVIPNSKKIFSKINLRERTNKVSSRKKLPKRGGGFTSSVEVVKPKFSNIASRLAFVKDRRFLKFILPLFALFLLAGFGYVRYLIISKSYLRVTLNFKAVPVQASKVFELSSENSIKPTQLEAEDAASTSANTTGEKITGDKANGTVSLFNPTTEIRVISANTTLTCISPACNNLTFVTQNDLNLGPGTSDEVKVVAGEIGTNYNVSPGAGRFKVANYNPQNEVLASNIKAISGATEKKTVKVVNKNDIVKAEESIMKSFKVSLLSKIKNDQANTDFVISEPTLIVTKLSSESDLKEGEEGDIVNVTIRAKASVTAFSKEEMQPILESFKKENTPDGFRLDDSKTVETSSFSDKTKGKLSLTLTVNSIAKPDINVDNVKKSLKGKSYSESTQILSTIKNITSYSEVHESKSIPNFLWKAPSNVNKIDVELKEEPLQSSSR